MTTGEVASVFRVTPRTVRRWRDRGVLAAVVVGGVVRFRRDDIEALLDPATSGPHPARNEELDWR